SIERLRNIARLPTKIRLKIAGLSPGELPSWLPAGAPCRRLNGHLVELDAEPDRKIELLHSATASGTAVEDLDVIPPTLD
ncbi:hypothetical protein ABTE44_20170, partial [Acinetobacter baumannii]